MCFYRASQAPLRGDIDSTPHRTGESSHKISQNSQLLEVVGFQPWLWLNPHPGTRSYMRHVFSLCTHGYPQATSNTKLLLTN